MAKTMLGIDMGYDRLKLVLMNGKRVKKAVTVAMPGNLVREGRVVSVETAGELIRDTLKKEGMHCPRAAVALPYETVFMRNVILPQMTADQLAYNLPFEFRDYITDELKNYTFDYAVTGQSHPEEEGAPPQIELTAVAAPTSLIDETRDILRKAGLRLVKAAPAVCSYISLIRQLGAEAVLENEYCILDLGYHAIRMHMFAGDRHVVSRVLEIGMSGIDEVIAQAYNVDVHLAHTYLMTNYDGCQSSEVCVAAYNNIAVELLRALNFYRFSNPQSQLADVWLCGGGAVIPPLEQAIWESLDMRVHTAEELVNDGRSVPECNTFVQAIGITQ